MSYKTPFHQPLQLFLLMIYNEVMTDLPDFFYASSVKAPTELDQWNEHDSKVFSYLGSCLDFVDDDQKMSI